MANNEESNPLLPNHATIDDEKEPNKPFEANTSPPAAESAKLSPSPPPFPAGAHYGWTANGLPVTQDSVMGQPLPRSQWNSGIFACTGQSDEFCSSDLEVCVIGTVAPCVLYGSNAERLGSSTTGTMCTTGTFGNTVTFGITGTFADHCVWYNALYITGNAFWGGNWFAPWFSYPSRTAIRRRFNLEGSCEALNRSCGCCGSIIEDEVQLEQCESICDFATHVFCHACALCQEGRELRRRVSHPGFNIHQQGLVMIPPGEQSMGRGAATN